VRKFSASAPIQLSPAALAESRDRQASLAREVRER
jgi:hypothetical protein